MKTMIIMTIGVAGILLTLTCGSAWANAVQWKHLSSVTGDLPAPNAGKEQTASLVCDLDGDGKLDIVGGGRWFKHLGGATYRPNIIDASYQFTRAAVGQLIEGGRPEVVLVVGDGWAPLMLYE